MLRTTFIIGLLSILMLPMQAQDGIVIDKIIAKVGGEILLKSELEENLALAEEQSGVLPDGAESLILNQLLGQKLLINQARLDSVLVSPEEVDGQLDARFSQILNLMGNQPEQFEEYYGISISEAREKLRADMENQLLAQRMQQQVTANVEITPSEVKAFFNRIPADSLPFFNSEVEIGEIVFYPEASDEEKTRAKNAANDFRTQIVDSGADFAELASKNSEDFGSARLGGDLGWQTRGQFVPEFEAAAFTLEIGQVSEVVETEFGFHVIQLIERLGNRIHTRHILIQPKITDADLEKAVSELNRARRLLATDSLNFNQAVKRYSSDKSQSFHNGGLMTNPNNGTTFFETSELDVDIYFTIDTMQVGQVSSPLKVMSPRNEVSYVMVKLVSMTEPHRASLASDYDKIKKAAINEKEMQIMEDWIQNAIKNTHTHLSSEYREVEVLAPWMKDKAKNP